MGLFGSKKNEPVPLCPICGRELRFLNSTVVADGTICDDCVKVIRPLYEKQVVCSKIRDNATGRISYDFSGRYHSTNRYQFASNREHDPVHDLTIREVREAMDILEAYNDWVRTEYGGSGPEPSGEGIAPGDVPEGVTAILKVRASELMMPRPIDVGLKRAKQLKGKTCACGYVAEGSFAKGDRVILISGGREHETELIDVLRGDIHATSSEVIAQNVSRHEAGKTEYAFLIFDGGDAIVMADDIIIKR